MPIRDMAKPLSISVMSDLPRLISVWLNQTVAPLATSRSYKSFAVSVRSAQAWQRKRSRFSGLMRACSSALRASGSIARHCVEEYDTAPPPRSRRVPPAPPPPPPPDGDPPPPLPSRMTGGGEYEGRGRYVDRYLHTGQFARPLAVRWPSLGAVHPLMPPKVRTTSDRTRLATAPASQRLRATAAPRARSRPRKRRRGAAPVLGARRVSAPTLSLANVLPALTRGPPGRRHATMAGAQVSVVTAPFDPRRRRGNPARSSRDLDRTLPRLRTRRPRR